MTLITNVVPYHDLSRTEIDEWSAIQREPQYFGDPFLSPDFAAVISEVRSDVRVAVLRSSGWPVGFFPFQYLGAEIAEPVGRPINDYQAVIVRTGCSWDVRSLFHACGI